MHVTQCTDFQVSRLWMSAQLAQFPIIYVAVTFNNVQRIHRNLRMDPHPHSNKDLSSSQTHFTGSESDRLVDPIYCRAARIINAGRGNNSFLAAPDLTHAQTYIHAEHATSKPKQPQSQRENYQRGVRVIRKDSAERGTRGCTLFP